MRMLLTFEDEEEKKLFGAAGNAAGYLIASVGKYSIKMDTEISEIRTAMAGRYGLPLNELAAVRKTIRMEAILFDVELFTQRSQIPDAKLDSPLARRANKDRQL